ncbi:hypothetical protein PBI_RICH_61 [Mycobacterium phage Rich]|uniref:Uncharacterized protein n=1 Tax=Mycobacterium phage Rich TaxID=1927021 RepID=A0A1L6BZ00_9CAUD|nr:hypothetical protein PBI_RICH_61 [Mycobacterium phage Rich]
MSAPEQRCPLCAKPLNPVEVRNALSRYTDRYICDRCGTVEAFTLARLNDNPNARTCLYFDEVMGVALVNETEAGYVPIWEAPPMVSYDWVRRYVDAVNERHGISVEDKFDIVGASMALGGIR